jgi:hypothetical protein
MKPTGCGCGVGSPIVTSIVTTFFLGLTSINHILLRDTTMVLTAKKYEMFDDV